MSSQAPRPGDTVMITIEELGRVRATVYKTYHDGVISVAFNEYDITPRIESLFIRHPQTGAIHYLAQPDEYELYGKRDIFH